MKKEEKFHAMKLFCRDRQMHKDAEDLFNRQVLFATSGAANYGIDSNNIYCVKCIHPVKIWFRRKEERDVGQLQTPARIRTQFVLVLSPC